MKKIFLPFLAILFLTSCHNAEIDTLKKENAVLSQQIADLQQGKTPTKTKYILKLHLKQSHFSLSIKKHLKDYANSIDFEIPVDKEYFDSVKEGEKLVDKFRFGSFVLYGSFGDWEMKVKEKIIR
ncbi:MAG: hypothetical protein H9535_14750 [Ignavibacteria bacterium]|nr:hypothetical protein [Ignavibacteria bacterium]